MLDTYTLETKKVFFYDISKQVKESVKKSQVQNGLCLVYCPHTTAGITINENADPNVIEDMLLALDYTFPDRKEFKHAEGNSAAHLKASAIGSSVTLIIEKDKLLLGTWQGIYFCEFDPPRKREFFVKIVA